MRVLQLGKHYPPYVGGTEKVIQVLTETLNFFGIKTDVLCSNHLRSFEELDFGGYKVIKTPRWFKFASTSISPLMIKKLREIMDDYDIIHVHMPDPMANLALFFARPKSKIVVQWHMDIVRQKLLLPLYKPLLVWLFKRADLILLSSQKVKKESQFKEFFKEKGEVLPLPFDNEEFKKAGIDESFKRRILELSKKRKIVLSVGRLVYYKGFDVLIKAGKLLPEDLTIFIVGEGPLRRKLEVLIKKLNLQDKVFLLGEIVDRSKLFACYEVCHLFCLPSLYRSESFGIVQLEAMSFGKPVISTRIPASGVCEVNIDGETGLCVEPGDEKALAEAILTLIKDKELYQRLSAKALKHTEKFYKDRIVKKLIDLYRNLLQVE